MKFNNILIPTDFSDASKQIIKEVFSTPEIENSNIYLLNVVDASDVNMYYGVEVDISVRYREEMYKKAKENIEALKKEFYYETAPEMLTGHVRSGSTSHEIVEFAKENDIDIIVMPTHGRKGVSRIFMGSIAEEVIREAHCPVITLKAYEK